MNMQSLSSELNSLNFLYLQERIREKQLEVQFLKMQTDVQALAKKP